MVAGVKGGTRLLGWSTRKVEILNVCRSITLLLHSAVIAGSQGYGCIQLDLLFSAVIILQVTEMGIVANDGPPVPPPTTSAKTPGIIFMADPPASDLAIGGVIVLINSPSGHHF